MYAHALHRYTTGRETSCTHFNFFLTNEAITNVPLSAVHGGETPTHSSMVISHNSTPGGASISMSNGKRSKPRTSITPQQLEVLKQAYLREQRPTKQTREDLMAKTGLDMKVSLQSMCIGHEGLL